MDDPVAVPLSPTASHDASPECPFCAIASTYPPMSPSNPDHEEFDPDKMDPPSFLILSTEDVVAFFDIAPLTRGHILVAPRKHRVKVGDLSPRQMAEIGKVLPLIARSIIRAVFPDIPHAEADYNVVQNNGPGAAQVIPHVHFHIIPRPPIDYRPPSPTTLRQTPDPANTSSSGRSKYGPSKLPQGIKASYIQFGRGSRSELDEEDAGVLARQIRGFVAEEWGREFGGASPPDAERGKGRRAERSPEKL